MRKPTIHLNGSHPQSLFDSYHNALIAVQEARAELAKCAPHGRDYYPQDQAGRRPSINEAMDEHRLRLVRLEDIEHDLEELALHVMDTSNGKVTA